ncbi:MAG: LytTR family transcriptional regulator DNA-binding domain-containing protein [Candidatus Cloacimonetes bacterium]|nr:LytTR family transcriptional regulator DNA-binding domain-containing protein [Candidatus Cloacimonadota bacterium]
MKMDIFRTIIVEDENLARVRLRKMLTEFADDLEIIAEAENGIEAVSMINSLQPDLIFLDVQLPGLNGFEVLENLVQIPMIIFTTAFDEFALKAFETNAIDYLLKPIEIDRLRQTMTKLMKFTGLDLHRYQKKVMDILSSLRTEKKFLTVRSGSRLILVKFTDILYCQADTKYTWVYTRSKKHLMTQSLKDLELVLPDNFKRIHRSTLVNLDHVKEIIKLSINKYVALIDNLEKTELPVSRKILKEIT